MDITIDDTRSDLVDHALEAIFHTCYPKQEWTLNNAYPNDRVIVARDGNDAPLGFVQIHSAPPYPFAKGVYLYNLCVLPRYRSKGVGTRLLKYVQETDGTALLHATLELYQPGWLERLGFQRGDIRGRYIEYSWSQTVQNTKKLTDDDIRKRINNPHYDYAENVIYLDPLY